MDKISRIDFSNENDTVQSVDIPRNSSGGTGGLSYDDLNSKKISELKQIKKISGTEMVLIEDVNGDGDTLKTTIDDLLGYIVRRINSGDIPDSQLYSNSIHIIAQGEDIPTNDRIKGDMYIKVVDTNYIPATDNTPSQIKVGPNMGLKVLEKGDFNG